MKKYGQSSLPTGVRESTFTSADLSNAIKIFIIGINDLQDIGLVKTDIPNVLSNTLGLATSLLVGSPGSNYLQRELILGSSKSARSNKNPGNIPYLGDYLASFSSRIAGRVSSASNKFNLLIDYSEEILDEIVPPDPSKAQEYERLKNILTRSISSEKDLSTREIKLNLFKLIDYMEEAAKDISNAAGINFSFFNQLLLLRPAVTTSLGVDEDSLSNDKINLDSISNDIKLKLFNLLKKIKNFKELISISNNINQFFLSNISNTVSSKSQNSKSNRAKTNNSKPIGSNKVDSLKILEIDRLEGFLLDQSSMSIKIINPVLTEPSIALKIYSTKTPKDAHDLFLMLYNEGLFEITNPTSIYLSSPQSMGPLDGIREIIANNNSNNIRLDYKPLSNSNYILKIELSKNISSILANNSIILFTINADGSKIIVKSANTYSIDDNISKIKFSSYDLVSDTSSLTNIERQKIINKIKKY